MKLIFLIASGAIILWLIVFESKKIRPLHGWPKITFMITAGPIFIFLMILNIALSSRFFPSVMGNLASHGSDALRTRGDAFLALLFACTLPALGLWTWYRLLLTQVNFPVSKYAQLLRLEQLSPLNIEIHKSGTATGHVLLFRPKELGVKGKKDDFFYITLNGMVRAALKSGEYTKIPIPQQINEIGCFAKPSPTNNYKFNFVTVKYSERPINFAVGSDIFAGSRIRALNSSKVQKYTANFRFVEPGPRDLGQQIRIISE